MCLEVTQQGSGKVYFLSVLDGMNTTTFSVFILCTKRLALKKKHSYSKTLQILNIEGWPRILHPSANGHWAVSRRIQAPQSCLIVANLPCWQLAFTGVRNVTEYEWQSDASLAWSSLMIREREPWNYSIRNHITLQYLQLPSEVDQAICIFSMQILNRRILVVYITTRHPYERLRAAFTLKSKRHSTWCSVNPLQWGEATRWWKRTRRPWLGFKI